MSSVAPSLFYQQTLHPFLCFSERGTTCLVWSFCGLPVLRLKCNSVMTGLEKKRKCCLHWDNIHQLTDDNMWWQNIDVTPKCVCGKKKKSVLCFLCFCQASCGRSWKIFPRIFLLLSPEITRRTALTVTKELIKGCKQAEWHISHQINKSQTNVLLTVSVIGFFKQL